MKICEISLHMKLTTVQHVKYFSLFINNCYCTYTVKAGMTRSKPWGRGALTWKGNTVMSGGQDPLFMPLWQFIRPPVALCFSIWLERPPLPGRHFVCLPKSIIPQFLAPEFVNWYFKWTSRPILLPFFMFAFAGFLMFCNGNYHCRRSNQE